MTRASKNKEAKWLTALAGTVRSRIEPQFGRLLGTVMHDAEETDPDSDGWYAGVGTLNDGATALYLFIDNSLGEDRRSLWYGVWARSRAGIEAVEESGRARWPHTQTWESDEFPANFRYQEPWLQHFNRNEHYYGWQEPDEPDVTRAVPTSLENRIVERFTDLLSVMGVDTESALSRLESLDALRTSIVRLEQKLLREQILKGANAAACIICGEQYEAPLLVAAHIKRRADATDAERRAATHNVWPMCALGCDALFERGYLIVANGHVKAGPRPPATKATRDRVSGLAGRRCEAWSDASAPYFRAHRDYHQARAD